MRKTLPTPESLILVAVMTQPRDREIARVLNISEANVKVRVHRARMKLKAILSSGGN